MTHAGSFVLFLVWGGIAVECLSRTLLRLVNAPTAKWHLDARDGELLRRPNGFSFLNVFRAVPFSGLREEAPCLGRTHLGGDMKMLITD